ncbi:peptidase U32 [Magnetococcus marinus MC-1]|uniref:Ubiquinone biosynthesis protein UbiV n=1 Tax=Magnetococcus marinus (strain ATCC BAA-1437 / JCM 17883 / MC-1) TaxID=156889 RepID=A0L5V3_MAGMM|nr:U32 family peptidase [Magnetococcus marinus]ABK43346.1 peptidase U32 [Magnetococcus marinus MC-1]
MKLSIGPVLFDWGKNGFRDFYKKMAFETEADILYIGEVVCSKRYNLNPAEMVELAEALKPSGKELVFSTLGLVMNEPEQQALREIVAACKELGIRYEANDMAALYVGEGQAAVAGPHITTYNPETADFLTTVGVDRIVMPVELSMDMVAMLIAKSAIKVEYELFAYGKIPLTFSARCYTSRAFNLPKSNCQYKCGDYADGMVMRTQEGKPLLTVNGIQTMSDKLFNVVDGMERMQAGGVHIARLSPQSKNMVAVVALWKQAVAGKISGAEARQKLIELNRGQDFCNGYFHGRAGLDFVDASMIQSEQLD